MGLRHLRQSLLEPLETLSVTPKRFARRPLGPRHPRPPLRPSQVVTESHGCHSGSDHVTGLLSNAWLPPTVARPALWAAGSLPSPPSTGMGSRLHGVKCALNKWRGRRRGSVARMRVGSSSGCRSTMVLVTGRAIDGPVAIGLERHLRFLATVCARGTEHRAGAAIAA
jgi:hypothetical protein